ncbi:protease modulator HflC [Endothiovibrio diazotrophicus]
MAQFRSLGLFGLAALALLLSFSMFTVNEREKAIMFRLGEIVRTDFAPGLYFKIPFINNVRTFDGRILTLDADPERYLTVEKKNVSVDAFIKWRIDDVANFYRATGGDEMRASNRLAQIIRDGMKAEFGKRTIQEVVSGERTQIMDILTVTANKQAADLGISIVDVRIKRIDLPRVVSSSVFQRMRAERERVARDFRSRGQEAAERIRADADRQRTVILAEAYREAEQTRGEGDAKSTEVYAAAYGKDPEFYAFYRSLDAYRNTFNSTDDMLIVDPDSDFFRYFKDPLGGARR